MDNTNQFKTTVSSPSTNDDHDTLAKRLSEKWASSARKVGRAGGQVLQRLAHGRVHVVAVESIRPRRRPIFL